MILTGKHILLGRHQSDESPLEDRLFHAGARVTCVPLIEIEPLAAIDLAGVNLRPDMVVITSKNSVAGYLQIRPQLGPHLLATVGRRTGNACEKRGVAPDIIGSGRGALALLETLASTCGVSGKHILYPCSNLVTDGFAARATALGATVEMLTVYRTATPAALSAESLDPADAVVFYSSSGARHFHEVRSFSSMTDTAAVAMGEQTANTLRELGASKVTVARRPDIDALFDAVVESVNAGARAPQHEDCEKDT
jgi:uroporphyrinogen-III synthase